MLKFDGNRAPALLEGLGFIQVSPANCGVYHLKKTVIVNVAAKEYIALLYSPAPMTPETTSIQIFLQQVPAPLPKDISPLQIQIHWQKLDARRLEESGVESVTIEMPSNIERNELPTIKYVRPGEMRRIRHCVQLLTGDVVCYN